MPTRVHSSRPSQRHRRCDWRHTGWPRSRTPPEASSRLLFPGQVPQCWLRIPRGEGLDWFFAKLYSPPNTVNRILSENMPVETTLSSLSCNLRECVDLAHFSTSKLRPCASQDSEDCPMRTFPPAVRSLLSRRWRLTPPSPSLRPEPRSLPMPSEEQGNFTDISNPKTSTITSHSQAPPSSTTTRHTSPNCLRL